MLIWACAVRIYIRVYFEGDCGGGVGKEGGVQSNPHWSPYYFIFMMRFEKMLEKWSNRTPTPLANLNPLSKSPGSAPIICTKPLFV